MLGYLVASCTGTDWDNHQWIGTVALHVPLEESWISLAMRDLAVRALDDCQSRNIPFSGAWFYSVKVYLNLPQELRVFAKEYCSGTQHLLWNYAWKDLNAKVPGKEVHNV